MNKRFRSLLLLLGAAIASPTALAGDDLIVYSARKEHLIKPLFDAYTAKTGTTIRYITDKAGPLLARLKAEGTNTPADILMTVDAGNLWHAAEEGVLARLDSRALTDNVPAHLRDPEGRWFGLSVRARTIIYSTERVKAEELSSYEGLADAKWRGRLCLRTSKKVYNQSLVAMMIARHGEERTEQVVRGWVDNLATRPFSNDTKLMQAIAAGQCDVGIVNSYYFGRLQKEEPAVKLALFWPGAAEGGTHINISGAGVTAHSRNRAEATRLLEWLSSEEAQGIFAGLNMEYPVKPGVKVSPLVAAWGKFEADRQNLATAGELQAAAVMLMDRAGYR
jgi:iron(III) transport system substrate-binding protein